MGKLTDTFRRLWREATNAATAPEKLEAAIRKGDKEAARTAIFHTRPARDLYEDQTIRKVLRYSRTPGHDTGLLAEIRKEIYSHYDIRVPYQVFAGDEEYQKRRRNEFNTGYQNPEHVYAIAAYLDDAGTMRKLHEKGVQPDSVSDRALHESIVMGTARLGAYDAMKEAIRQGASLDLAFGNDDFPPIHAFGKPLFHSLHKGVTEALLESGNARIITVVKNALGKDNGQQNRPRRITAPQAAL